MRDFELAMKAVGDPTRTRILKLLEERRAVRLPGAGRAGPRALHGVEAPRRSSSIAGLVEDQRDGKWIEYALADGSRNPHAKPVLDLLHRHARPGPGRARRSQAPARDQGDPDDGTLCPPRCEGPHAGAADSPPQDAKGSHPCLRRLRTCCSCASRTRIARRWPRASRARSGAAGWPRAAPGPGPPGRSTRARSSS